MPRWYTGKKFTKEEADGLALKLKEWIKVPGNFWLGSFAVEYGFRRQRLTELAEQFPDTFGKAYEEARQHQENKIFLGALTKKLDGYMAWCALKNVAEWRDKTEVDQHTQITYVRKSSRSPDPV